MTRSDVEAKKRPSGKVCTGKDLAAALAKVDLSDDERRAWSRELKKSRKLLMMKRGASKWER